MDDHRIIRSVQSGDVDAFALLVRKYHRNLLAFIFRLVRDRHLAEDIGQEVFLCVYKSLAGFDPGRGTPFAAWLFIIARNRCVSELRRRSGTELVPFDAFRHLASSGDTAEKELIGREERQALYDSLAQLPEPFRGTVMMSLRGASLEEIALTCGVPRSTVKTRLFRARERLRLFLKGYCGGLGYERKI